MNDLGWELDLSAVVYCPYTRVGEATEVFLANPSTVPYPVVMVDVSAGPWGYHDYMAGAWRRRKDFINIEHDVIPWPGAIQELMSCSEPWCFFGYQDQCKDVAANGAAMFGLVRFRRKIMMELPDLWTDRKTALGDCSDYQAWGHLDIWMFPYATERGFYPTNITPRCSTPTRASFGLYIVPSYRSRNG